MLYFYQQYFKECTHTHAHARNNVHVFHIIVHTISTLKVHYCSSIQLVWTCGLSYSHLTDFKTCTESDYIYFKMLSLKNKVYKSYGAAKKHYIIFLIYIIQNI